uniref:Uncharacterized protein n=1 Tax=Rhizophora mucronata TaxID=61149 RepID=A0A2P2R3E9_RHIMU
MNRNNMLCYICSSHSIMPKQKSIRFNMKNVQEIILRSHIIAEPQLLLLDSEGQMKTCLDKVKISRVQSQYWKHINK